MVMERIDRLREKAGRGRPPGKKKFEKEDFRGKIILLAGIGAFAFLLGLAIFGNDGFLDVTSYGKKMDLLEDKIEDLEQRNSKLAREIKLLKTDPRYIEKIAREELGMARRDELIYLFQDQTQNAASAETEKKVRRE